VLAVENTVVRQGGALDLMIGIGFLDDDRFGNILGEEDLAGVGDMTAMISASFRVAADVNLQVDVVCTPHVAARKDRREFDNSSAVSELNATQEDLLVRWLHLGRAAHEGSARRGATIIRARRRRHMVWASGTAWASGSEGCIPRVDA